MVWVRHVEINDGIAQSERGKVLQKGKVKGEAEVKNPRKKNWKKQRS
jgi:hypothetical protein